jgi:hypothetical protein
MLVTNIEIFSDLDDGLIHYYPLKNTTDVKGNNDLTQFGGVFNDVKCKKGACFNLTNDYFTLPSGQGTFAQEGFSVCVWSYVTTAATQRVMVQGAAGTASDNMEISIDSSGYISESLFIGGASRSSNTDVPLDDKSYTLVCGGYRDLATNKMFTCMNSTCDDNDYDNTQARQVVDTQTIYIGRSYAADAYYTGRMDELMIWNRGLNQSEIDLLYNDGAGLFYNWSLGIFGDGANVAPVINHIRYPLNGTHINTWNGTIWANVTDANPEDLVICAINITGIDDYLMAQSGTKYKKTNIAVSNFLYNYTIRCYDDEFIAYKHGWFVYDTIKPTMDYYIPANGSTIIINNTPLMNWSMRFNDLYLYEVNSSIIMPNGTIFDNKFIQSGPGYPFPNGLNFTEILNMSNETIGIWLINTTLWDFERLNRKDFHSCFYLDILSALPVHNNTAIMTILDSETSQPIFNASLYQFAFVSGEWRLDSNYTSDIFGKMEIGYADGANYTWIFSKPGYDTLNVTIGIIIYPEYTILLSGGNTLNQTMIIFMGIMALAFFMFSFWAKRISISVIAGVLMMAFGVIIWPLSMAFWIIFMLAGLYGFVSIMF